MKIIMISGYTPSLLNFRGDLIKAMVAKGYEVIAVGPESGYEEQLAELGARFAQLPLVRTGTNPLNDLTLILKIYKFIKSERPDLVFSYTIKPVIFGSIAARMAGVKNIHAMLTGLGYVFTARGKKAAIIRSISKTLYKVALKSCKRVLFQNPDDLNEFVSQQLVDKSKTALINGSGVNMDYFSAVPLPQETSFLMICRIIKDKGVTEYLRAAEIVKQSYPQINFSLVGPFDTNPNSLSYEAIQPFIDSKIVDYLGEAKDVRPFIEAASVFVLPSYREGTPRTVLEAMAMGRAIITTDAPGCRETVVHGVNGFLVPVKDVNSIVEAMIFLIENNDDLIRKAGKSLEICKEKYEVNKVNNSVMNILEI
ncbi:glycosyltransferase family 4 protein [Paenibacillus sp. FSL H7-0756]|uniref:glycosyltransferase family 4 protein n=1 Tax=Paenibacillus sp. FSL H7-0756 TaxID=2954738 RepID=UPI0030F6ABA4